MGDIENSLAAAATAEPSRHGFWAWKERFVLNHLTLYNPADDDDATNQKKKSKKRNKKRKDKTVMYRQGG